MKLSITDAEDIAFLLKNAELGRRADLGHFDHLDQYIGILSYIRIANIIVAEQANGSKILDWGCGLGQMTYLLQRRGMRMTAYDVSQEFVALPDLPLTHEFERILGSESTSLPFDTSEFDAVLSCGVLEHVDEFSEKGNEVKSLREIMRLLKPAGKFYIYQLPQQFAWQEALVRWLKLGYSHPRRYSVKEIKQLLSSCGFDVMHINRTNFIPRNLTGLPKSIKHIYSKFSKILLPLDWLLCRIPGLNTFAGALEITAIKK